ncbi:MAG: hypothetical protein SGI77_21765 [Pirellulaceae bacterium]|nr:hypothetical protein [Pirellulaceae bacterium]
MIPDFRDDGYLPEGLHTATENEVVARFGISSSRRQRLIVRLMRWLALARSTRASRFLIDGSFVTADENPNDLDAVVFLSHDFQDQVFKGRQDALERESMLISRNPEELFAAEDSRDWYDWVPFFSKTREPTNVRKGLVQIQL